MTDRIMTPGPLLIAVQKDSVYFWQTICFSVEGCLFQVSQYQFIIGSDYFAEKYGLGKDGESNPENGVVELEGVTAAQFRTFLKLLFPIHSITTTLTFAKDEWLTILALSTLWKFHDFRRLAITHLDPVLTDPVELVQVGRSAYVTEWVLGGFEILIGKPEAISEEECDCIGDRTAIRLYIIRHEAVGDTALSPIVRSKFAAEISLLEREEMERRTKAHTEEEQRLKGAEERPTESGTRKKKLKDKRKREERRRQEEAEAIKIQEEREPPKLPSEQESTAEELEKPRETREMEEASRGTASKDGENSSPPEVEKLAVTNSTAQGDKSQILPEKPVPDVNKPTERVLEVNLQSVWAHK